jgi:hypothetical protein
MVKHVAQCYNRCCTSLNFQVLGSYESESKFKFNQFESLSNRLCEFYQKHWDFRLLSVTKDFWRSVFSLYLVNQGKKGSRWHEDKSSAWKSYDLSSEAVFSTGIGVYEIAWYDVLLDAGKNSEPQRQVWNLAVQAIGNRRRHDTSLVMLKWFCHLTALKEALR